MKEAPDFNDIFYRSREDANEEILPLQPLFTAGKDCKMSHTDMGLPDLLSEYPDGVL